MKIDENIPIPPRMTGGGGAGSGRPRTAIGKAVRNLELGQSILFDNERDANRARAVAKHIKIGMTLRKTRDGWRVWRTA